MGFERWLEKLDQEDRRQLLLDVLAGLEPDEKYAVIVQLERELKAMHYDWLCCREEL